MADFTEIYKQSGSLCTFSPDGSLLASAVQYRLVIRDAESLEILQLHSCLDSIQHIEWSPDGTLVLVCSYKLGSIQVFKVGDENWTAKIDEAAAGCVAAHWADARHILSFSDFNLRITVWSLCDKEATYLQYPKYSDRGYSFRSDGKYFALAERVDCKDYVSVYETKDWSMVKRWPVETHDLDDICWSPDGRYIAVWEPTIDYKVFIYHPDGRLVNSYSAYSEGLGIKSINWSPSSQFLALGSYDQKLRLLNYYTWAPLVEMKHPKEITSPIHIFKEVHIEKETRYELISSPFTIPTTKPDIEKPNPKLGVGLVSFSCDGQYCLSRNDNMPCSLWVWDITTLSQVALIQQLSPIKQAKWNPLKPGTLAYVCNNGYLYLWESSLGCESIQVPAVNFKVSSFDWNPDGKSLVLMDIDKFLLAFPIDE